MKNHLKKAGKMKKHTTLAFILILFTTLTACQGVTETAPPASTNTPVPSLTPSLTLEPTVTFAPTWTPTATQPPTPTPPTYVREGNTIPVPDEAITAENADQIVELARLGKGAIQEVQLSPNRLMLIVRTTIGVYGYDADTLQEIWSWEDPSGHRRHGRTAAGTLDRRRHQRWQHHPSNFRRWHNTASAFDWLR